MKPVSHSGGARSRFSALGRAARQPLLVLGGIAVVVIAASCVDVQRTVAMPPGIPGAEYIGSAECGTCHDDVQAGFATASHAKLLAKGENGLDMGCESCHGPGSLHAEAGGGKGTILNPGDSPDTCYHCHLQVKGQFHLPNAHPVEKGMVTCNECHDPHQGDAVARDTSLEGQSATCASCHVAQRGPYVFEHEALRDGCTACHEAHGSVNAKMLKVRNANLCLQCHVTERAGNTVLVGGRDHTGFLSRGTCWTAGCHEAVHGSNVNSSLRY